MSKQYCRDVGRRIKDFRIRARLDQTGAAAQLGVSQRAWSDYEHGRGLTLKNLPSIAQIVQAPLVMLLVGPEIPENREDMVAEITSLLGELDDKQREAFHDMIAAAARRNYEKTDAQTTRNPQAWWAQYDHD